MKTTYKIFTLFLSASQLAVTLSQTTVSDCHLPTGTTGLCTPLARCTHIKDLIGNLKKPLPRDVALLIRESFSCGTGPDISVCCPQDGLQTSVPIQGLSRGSCQLQGNLSAECVSYDVCSPFVQLMANLGKPLPDSTPRLIRSSFLCGKEEGRGVPKVCCPSQALQAESPTPATTTTKPKPLDRFSDHPARSTLADSESCGLPFSSKRIVGGKNADIGQYTWLVNLGYTQNNRGEKLFKCGGTLIGRQHVLTAAHCVTELPKGFDLKVVRVGEYDLSKAADCGENFCTPAPQDIQVEKVITHEKYGKPASFQNDIAIIKLASKVEINDYVSPICLPYNDDKEDYIAKRIQTEEGEFEVFTEVAGWGATTKFGKDPANILQFLEVNITDTSACKEIYASRGGTITSNHICAGGEKAKDSCVGDSGSALMRNRPGGVLDRWDIIGIVSFGPRLCGTEAVPGVYTRVNSYISWILDSIAAN